MTENATAQRWKRKRGLATVAAPGMVRLNPTPPKE
jgi:hypothetical protein